MMRVLMLLLLCVSLTACGTKPKKLEGPKSYPAQYPSVPPQTPLQPQPPPPVLTPPQSSQAQQAN